MNTRRLMVASMALIGMLAPRAGAESYTTNIVDGVTNCVAGNYYVGDAGPFNRLIVTNAGVLDVSLTSGIGHRINGDNNIAIVTGTGSIWAAGLDFTVGKWSSGNRLIVSNGASVRLSNDNNAFFLGSAYKNVFAGDNRVLVTGPGSTLLLPRSFYLGYNDTLGFGGGTSNNSLTIADGAVVTNRSTTGSVSCHIRIGYLFTECTTPADTSSNAVTVTGAGSRWYIYNTKQLANEFYLGHDCPANSLNISAGGQVIMAGTNGNLLMAGCRRKRGNGSEPTSRENDSRTRKWTRTQVTRAASLCGSLAPVTFNVGIKIRKGRRKRTQDRGKIVAERFGIVKSGAILIQSQLSGSV
jgi:T5SS/PEP-CTERM-associated repeat protein